VRQTEEYNSELWTIYDALQDIDATAVFSPDIESARRNAVDFYRQHSQKTVGSLTTLATIMLMKQNHDRLSSAGRAVVLGTCAIASLIREFVSSKALNAMAVVVSIYNTLKGARNENDVASMMSHLSLDDNMDDGAGALVTVPASKTKIGTVITLSLVTARYLYSYGYLPTLNTSISFSDALDLVVTTVLPVLPASIVYWTTSQFLNPGPTTGFASITYFLGLGSLIVKTLYQKLDEKKQKEVDEKISEALQRTIAAVPKIPEAIGRAADTLPGAALVVGGLLVLSSFSGSFGALGTTIKEKQRSTVLKKRRKQ
jgi:hypothetical protein